jgi:predicted dehydrogenase
MLKSCRVCFSTPFWSSDMAKDSVSTDSLAIPRQPAHEGRKLRLAFIGCGGVLQFYMHEIPTMPEIDVVAGCDIDPGRLKIAEEKWGITRHYADWNEMLRDVKPDAVAVCTPNHIHMQPTIDALNAGVHVLVEKPMAMNARECERMIDAARRNDRKLVIGFQYRYHPNTQFLKRARDGGHFGDVMFVKCLALRRRGIPNWGVFGRKDLQGGGPMIDIGVHVIEMAHYTMGSPRPVAASANTWTYLGNKPSDVVSQWPGWDWKTYTVEDYAIGQVRFENGAVMQIEAAFAAHIEKDEWNFKIVGQSGGGAWDPPALHSDQYGTMLNCSPAFVGHDTGFYALFRLKLRNFAEHVLHDKPTEAPAEAGLMVQKILDGMYGSAEAKREVTID